ncbi:MAG: alpha/beta fold hydrolase [Bacteroidetes bacterium]|nr:alpha/beta fold hydrolase [Bacteroidota bacterium]
MKTLILFFGFISISQLHAQLTLTQIMDDPKVSVGNLPSSPFWSEDSKTLYFNWNPKSESNDSLYAYDLKAGATNKWPDQSRLPARYGVYNADYSLKAYSQNGDIYLLDCKTQKIKTLTNTLEEENELQFNDQGNAILFEKARNLYTLDISSGLITQLSNFQFSTPRNQSALNEQDKWLKTEQLELFSVLKERDQKRKRAEQQDKYHKPARPRTIYLQDKNLDFTGISPNSNFIAYATSAKSKEKNTIVPNYVTESGYTTDITSREKVGVSAIQPDYFLYDRSRDTVFQLDLKTIEGMYELPAYLQDYPDSTRKTTGPLRKVYLSPPLWSDNNHYAVVTAYSADNKDRWMLQLDPENGKLKTLDRQHDDAWIGGPIDALGFLGDNKTLYFQSEADGFAHLYTINLENGSKTQLTKGQFEVQSVQLSRDKQWFFLRTNEVHPGEQHIYKMSVKGGERIRMTFKVGAHQDLQISPDGKYLAYLYSSTTQPWEVFIQEAHERAKPIQITNSRSATFNGYGWREPKIITIPARDGAQVYARLYEANGKNGEKPAVIFVHGAGYLQNAHKWWSRYFRENMFHNYLADKGYTVLDIDYRGSAGYGSAWRTAIYRNMGGKDLDDQVDGAKWLVENQGINPKRIGIYGGSYGGFITLMAMFKTPDVFAAGAALRPVTDWSAYNHGYTSNILNEPFTDPIAYRRSGPIYYADGLKGHLLICHGMIDTNVHFQDVVRLTQRLIELKKDGWELAAYPLEDHGFVEPSSWLDEYKRIFKLFETHLK